MIEVLARCGCNVSDAAADLGVPASDLRRLMWSKPQLQDAAFEVVEARIDKAEKNIAEALDSEDSRRRDAASFFVLRNSARAKRRGWIVSASAGVDVNVGADLPPRRIIISWQSPDDKEDDANDKLEDGHSDVEAHLAKRDCRHPRLCFVMAPSARNRLTFSLAGKSSIAPFMGLQRCYPADCGGG